ncbi:MAG: hypothetical protein ABMA64_08625 [Myxococcota bacterium]
MSRWWVAVVLAVGCAGDEGQKDTPQTNPDGDADTDADADSDADVDTDVTHTTEPYGSMSGQVIVDLEVDGDNRCHAIVDLAGSPYTGDCPGCTFAFSVESSVTENQGNCALSPARTWTESGVQVRPILAFSEEFGLIAQYGPAVFTTLHDVLWFGSSYDFTPYGGAVYPGPYWSIVTHSEVEAASTGGYYYYYSPYANSGGAPASFDGASLSWEPRWANENYYEYTEYLDWTCSQYLPSTYALGPVAGVTTVGTLPLHPTDTIDVYEFDAAANDVITVGVDTVDPATAFDPSLQVTDSNGCLLAQSFSSYLCTYADPNAWSGSYTYCPALDFVAPTTGTYRVVVGGYSAYSSGYYVDTGTYGVSIVGSTLTQVADDTPRVVGPQRREQLQSVLIVVGQ